MENSRLRWPTNLWPIGSAAISATTSMKPLSKSSAKSMSWCLSARATRSWSTRWRIDFAKPEPAAARGNGHSQHHNLNQRYTFHSLVVGDFNQFACAAAMAVAEGPGMTRYNPLLIYGGTGLGKTHIAQAIGNHILDNYPGKQVMYATSEKFTSDFIAAISDRTTPGFAKQYRDGDVLIIDDIQFFTGKESTQEQFFHTFNALYHSGKQIILTSDRPPRRSKDWRNDCCHGSIWVWRPTSRLRTWKIGPPSF